MNKYQVSTDMQRMVLFMIDNSVEYVDLCIKQKKRPDDPKVLRDFLISKGVFTARMGTENMVCGAALFELFWNLRKFKYARGGPLPATIVISLTLVDLISAGNNCTFIQELYYHHVLKGPGANVANRPVHSVHFPRTEIKPASDPNEFLSSITPETRLQCDVEKVQNDNAKEQAKEVIMVRP